MNTQKQTPKTIADQLREHNTESIFVKINRFHYDIRIVTHERYGMLQEIEAVPRRNGDTACNMDTQDYRYTHGGHTYRLAVELCNAVFAAL